MNIGPYDYIKATTTTTKTAGKKKERTFRLAIYGAFNAYGLIGPERNGIVILDEDERAVLCDDICRGDSLNYISPAPDPVQLQQFETLRDMDWKAFQEFINHNPRSRYAI